MRVYIKSKKYHEMIVFASANLCRKILIRYPLSFIILWVEQLPHCIIHIKGFICRLNLLVDAGFWH
jgi:hypothetical protein